MKTNNTYTIEISSPLLRPGITIRTEVSEKYVVAVVQDLIEKIREINNERVQN